MLILQFASKIEASTLCGPHWCHWCQLVEKRQKRAAERYYIFGENGAYRCRLVLLHRHSAELRAEKSALLWPGSFTMPYDSALFSCQFCQLKRAAILIL